MTGWDDANGDCKRSLSYGLSLAQVLENPAFDNDYKTRYTTGYTEAWDQGETNGYCDPDAQWPPGHDHHSEAANYLRAARLLDQSN
jgi:hypothetical protein